MTRRVPTHVGHVMGASFGMVFVLVNSIRTPTTAGPAHPPGSP